MKYSTGQRALTRVEVFGFGQLDGGARLFLQLYDGLAALANYRAGRIAGDQHLQEVLTFLCRQVTEKESQNVLHSGNQSTCTKIAQPLSSISVLHSPPPLLPLNLSIHLSGILKLHRKSSKGMIRLSFHDNYPLSRHLQL